MGTTSLHFHHSDRGRDRGRDRGHDQRLYVRRGNGSYSGVLPLNDR